MNGTNTSRVRSLMREVTFRKCARLSFPRFGLNVLLQTHYIITLWPGWRDRVRLVTQRNEMKRNDYYLSLFISESFLFINESAIDMRPTKKSNNNNLCSKVRHRNWVTQHISQRLPPSPRMNETFDIEIRKMICLIVVRKLWMGK